MTGRCFRTLRLVGAGVLGSLLSLGACSAGDWPSWRGPHGNGTADGPEFPIEWSAEKNIDWKFAIPGIGASTPVVVGDSIYLTTTDEGQNLVLCLGRDGQLKWKGPIGKAVDGKPGKDGTGANPSAVSDGKLVFAYFKSGDLGCYSAKGELKWQTNLQERFGEDTLWWDLGTSPILTDDAVIIACMHSGPSYVAAFSKTDGKLLWKHDRDLGAPEEAAQSYSTPILVNDGQQDLVVVLGADHVTAHSLKDGHEVWRVGGLNPTGHKYFRSIASPSFGDGVVVAPYARGESLTAIKLGGAGDVTKSHILWENESTSADVPTPAVAEGRVYVVRDVGDKRGTIDCLDLQSGKTIWTGQLEEHRMTYRSSPVYASGKLYVTRQDGTVFVLDAKADSFKVLAKNEIANEHTVATPVLVDGKVLLRTSQTLYCIGQ